MAKTPEDEELAGLLAQERSKTPEEAYVDLCKAQLAGFPREDGPRFSNEEYGIFSRPLDNGIFGPADAAEVITTKDEVDTLRANLDLLAADITALHQRLADLELSVGSGSKDD